jgi:hypothetical protein
VLIRVLVAMVIIFIRQGKPDHHGLKEKRLASRVGQRERRKMGGCRSLKIW